MLSLSIEFEDATTDGLILKLECITDRLKQGYTRGEGFNVTGEEEAPEDEDEIPNPYVYKPEHGEVELIIRDDYDRAEPAVYTTIVSEAGEVVGQLDHDDEDAAMQAWPSVDWRAGDKEDGRGVVAVGHYLPKESLHTCNDLNPTTIDNCPGCQAEENAAKE